jgi:hypothetical protein
VEPARAIVLGQDRDDRGDLDSGIVREGGTAVGADGGGGVVAEDQPEGDAGGQQQAWTPAWWRKDERQTDARE